MHVAAGGTVFGYDIDPGALDRAPETVAKRLELLRKYGLFAGDIDAARSRFRVASDPHELSVCDAVTESVNEDPQVK